VVPLPDALTEEKLADFLIHNEIVQGFRKILKAEDFHLSFNQYNPEGLLEFIQSLVESPNYCNGIFFLTGIVNHSPDRECVVRLLLESGFPHISMDRRDEIHGVNTVTPYLLDAMRTAIRHLSALGHTRIGYLGEKPTRFSFFHAAMLELEMELKESYSCFLPMLCKYPSANSDVWKQLARDHFGKWLDRGPAATAVVCHNDMTAFGAIEAMKERGLTPGRDISIVGYDNIEKEGSEHPVLTTLDNPRFRVGELCAIRLLQQIGDSRFRKRITHEHVPVGLIERSTTGPCPEAADSSKITP
jgi:LacI family transcriptional regulator